MAIAAARRIAFETLLRVETAGAYADEVLRARLAEPKLKRADAALATELVMGTLRWQRLLDFLIEQQLNQPKQRDRAGGRSRGGRGASRVHAANSESLGTATPRLAAEVQVALRLGLYQLRWLERIPARAAVHESVELVKRARKASAAGLVNAVLRRAPLEPAEDMVPRAWPPAERLAVLGSHPTWLVERWLAALGEEETWALLAANNSPPRVTCAVAAGQAADAVTAELQREGVTARTGRWLRAALEIDGAVARTQAWREGRVRTQDEASQMVALLLDVEPGMRVLDVCAAPGGKALALAEAAGARGQVVACDRHTHRLRAMRERLRSWPQVALLALDAEQELPLKGEFDAILVDVPCSGTGTLARNPEIRWRLRAADLADLRARQTAILHNAAARLRLGGRLVYSTCSLEPEENEHVVEAVLRRRPGLRMVSGEAALAPHLQLTAATGRSVRFPDSGAVRRTPETGEDAPPQNLRADTLFDARGCLRTWPQRHGIDGFFAAVMERV